MEAVTSETDVGEAREMSMRDYCGESQEDLREGLHYLCLKRASPSLKQQKLKKLVDFMNSLGASYNQQLPSSSQSSNANDQQSSTNGPLQDSQKKQILKSIKRNPFLPLTSQRGLQLLNVTQDGTEAGRHFPPKFEAFCGPKGSVSAGARGNRRFPVTTKWSVTRQRGNAHVFTLGSRQRALRYAKLNLELNKQGHTQGKKRKRVQSNKKTSERKVRTCARTNELLLQCKPVRLVLEKRDPSIKRVTVPKKVQETSYLGRKFRGAIEFPVIKLDDFTKNATDEVRRYLPKHLGGDK